MYILLTNDDGINSAGIQTLKNELQKNGHEILVVAPSRNQSGCSHSMSFYKKILLKKIGKSANCIEYSLDGTPADCVKLGISKLADKKIDLVISGVNDLANSGTDLLYSGTFHGAFEGTVCGVDSVAISAVNEEYIETAVDFLLKNLEIIKNNFFEKPLTLNINVPNKADKLCGVKICPIGVKKYEDLYEEIATDNPDETEYLLYGDEIHSEHNQLDCDVNLLKQNYITVTPITIELVNNYKYCEKLKDIALS